MSASDFESYWIKILQQDGLQLHHFAYSRVTTQEIKKLILIACQQNLDAVQFICLLARIISLGPSFDKSIYYLTLGSVNVMS